MAFTLSFRQSIFLLRKRSREIVGQARRLPSSRQRQAVRLPYNSGTADESWLRANLQTIWMPNDIAIRWAAAGRPLRPARCIAVFPCGIEAQTGYPGKDITST